MLHASVNQSFACLLYRKSYDDNFAARYDLYIGHLYGNKRRNPDALKFVRYLAISGGCKALSAKDATDPAGFRPEIIGPSAALHSDG